MYSIDFVSSAKKEFMQLSNDDKPRIVSVLERIRPRPYLHAMRLSGSKAYRIRVGKLRIIVDIVEDAKEIVVLKIGNRENIYLP